MSNLPIYVHVGITGHRRLPQEHLPAIMASVNRVLDTVVRQVNELHEHHEAFYRSFDGGTPPAFRLISSLALGADTLVADAALQRGFSLMAPIPFGVDIYEKDFDAEEDKKHYRELLAKAESVLEMKACSKEKDSSQGYADSSNAMLCHSDVLLALWDGKPTSYKAGTYATLRQARKEHMPIIVIRTDLPEAPISYVTYADSSDDWEELLRREWQTMLLPSDDEKVLRARVVDPLLFRFSDVFRSKKRRQELAELRQPLLLPISNPDRKYTGWKSFVAFGKWLCKIKKPSTPPQRVKPSRTKAQEFDAHLGRAESQWESFKNELSKPAGYYGVLFKEQLFRKYFLPVICMVSIILAINFNNISFGKAIKEAFNQGMGLNLTTLLLPLLGVLMLISVFSLVLKLTAQNNKVVHGRFTTYRILSERCRNSKFLWSVGYCRVSSPRFRPGEVRWETWYYRLMLRKLGLPAGQLDYALLRQWLRWLSSQFLQEQAQYHENRAIVSEQKNEALFSMARYAFFIGIAMSMGRILLGECFKMGYMPADLASWLLPFFGTLTLLCPCIGTFLMAFSAFAGFPADLTASRTMENTFDALLCDVEALLKSDVPVSWADVYELCQRLDEYCLGDICNWESTLTSNKAWLK